MSHQNVDGNDDNHLLPVTVKTVKSLHSADTHCSEMFQ
jgi:hypothetical protein